jgi:ribonuclease P protein component
VFRRSTAWHQNRIRPNLTQNMIDPAPARFRVWERIRDKTIFDRAYQGRRSAADERLVVYALENGLEHPRLGISVGRKKVRGAVARNRVKRLLREAFRLSKRDLPRGVDLVVVPRHGDLTFAQVRDALPKLAHAAASRLRPRSSAGQSNRKPGESK